MPELDRWQRQEAEIRRQTLLECADIAQRKAERAKDFEHYPAYCTNAIAETAEALEEVYRTLAAQKSDTPSPSQS